MAKSKPVIAISAPVTVTAGEGEGEHKGPAKFESTFYTGGQLAIDGWDLPVVVDLAGLNRGNVLVANLDHDRTKRVGNFDVMNDGKSLVAHGTATAKTQARDEVVGSASEGYQWQSSLEVNPSQIEEVKAGKTVEVNGQSFKGPIYVTRKGTLKGFAFVSHGADDNTTVSIAAHAAQERNMKAEVKAWAESMGIDVDSASPEQIAAIEANYAGRNGGKRGATETTTDPFELRRIEAKRRKELQQIADRYCDDYEDSEEDINEIQKLHAHAVATKQTAMEFRTALYESTFRPPNPVRGHRGVKAGDPGVTNKMLEAAVLQAGRYPTLENHFTDQELQTAHDRFKGRIGLKQLLLIAAQANGYNDGNMEVTLDVQRAAFRMGGYNQTIRGSGFSTIDIATIVSNTANKQIMRGWNSIDQTCLRISKIQNVSNFQQITTVSLTDSVRFEQIGADGEIKHGTLDEITYTNQADTYAKMLAITRKDIINDNLGALNDVPMKLGNGAMKLLNHIFWTEFLSAVGASFFASGNSNINTGVADMTVGGLDATEAIFMNQTNPDATPLGIMPAIVLVPTALRNKAEALINPRGTTLITGASSTVPDLNVFAGRFRVESSPYISNSSYTGYTAQAWWMLANPEELPVIAIAALNGRVEPIVETSDAEFNTLGIQMRGYSDVGVNLQEYRGGVHADGNAS